MNGKGKFITIEGCEGVGKSTLVEGLKRRFAEMRVRAVFTREPGGTPAAEKIRSVVLDARNASLTPYAELLLYAAARAQHTEEFIIPELSRGNIVVCDRYSDSTLAYQGYARGLDAETCRRLNVIAERGVKVDLTLFLDLDPAEGFRRKGGADGSDRLENAGMDFHRRVYEGFRKLISENGERFAVIDASLPPERVLADAIAALRGRGVI